jgi:hypothetical protein
MESDSIAWIKMANKIKLYKYLEPQHANSMMSKGEILIGTLFGFRQLECPNRGDKDEGRKDSIATFPEGITVSSADEFEKLGIFKNSNFHYVAGTTKFPKIKFIKTDDSLDTYIYCTSRIYSKKLKKDFKADFCIEIFDMENFLIAVSSTMSEMDLIYPTLSSVGDCQYVGHEVDSSNKVSGNWLKAESYKHQREVRFSFVPLIRRDGKVIEPSKVEIGVEFPRIEVDIKPVKIKCEEAIKFCRCR